MKRSLPVAVAFVTSLLFAQHGEEWSAFEKRMGEMHYSHDRLGWPVLEGHLSAAERRVIIESIVKAMNSPNNYGQPRGS